MMLDSLLIVLHKEILTSKLNIKIYILPSDFKYKKYLNIRCDGTDFVWIIFFYLLASICEFESQTYDSKCLIDNILIFINESYLQTFFEEKKF